MRQRAEQWTTIRIRAEEAGRPDERRLHQEYSLHLESEGRPDAAVIYRRRDDDGGQIFYFSPKAATLAGALLDPFSPRPVSSSNMRDLRQQGIQLANWRHSYVNLR
jgi:hypothetical protein